MPNSRTTFFNVTNDHLQFSHTRFKDAADNKIVTHTHEFPEVIYIVEAHGSHITEDKEYILKSGDLILTPPAVSHRMVLTASTPYERYCFSFDPVILEDINPEKIYNSITVINCAKHSILTDIFKKADYYSKILPQKEFTNILDMLVKEIFYNLSVYEGNFDSTPNVLSPILSKAISFINNNLYEISSVSDVSNSLFIAESYLFKIFKEQLKTSPKRYITAKRLHAARNEILLGVKPTEVYSKIGFSDYASFYKSYVKFFGHSPGKEKQYGFTYEKL